MHNISEKMNLFEAFQALLIHQPGQWSLVRPPLFPSSYLKGGAKYILGNDTHR